jgi:hypothetical protein
MISEPYVMMRVEHVLCNALFCYSVLLFLCTEYIFMSTFIKLCKNYLVDVMVNSRCDDLCYAWSADFISYWFHNAYKIL